MLLFNSKVLYRSENRAMPL